MDRKTTRRAFLSASAAIAGGVLSAAGLPTSSERPATAMPERELGNTGIRLPVFGLGGAGQTPLSRGPEAAALTLVERALELGIRYFDTAADYGPSEAYLGKVLPAHRDRIFLASKTAQRDRDSAWRELERSLQRLNTDRLDLWQMHHVAHGSELDALFGPDGAIRAVEEAKAQGVVRFAGITGHYEPDVIVAGLERYPFDTTLIPLNAGDRHHPRPFAPTVLPVARERNVGVIAMKVPAYGRLFRPGGLDGMYQALGYVLSQPGVHTCVVAAESPEQLSANVEVARAFQPLSAAELAAIEQRVAAIWQETSFYRSWG
ncbi:aldo/keto reductase [Synechococcus sp. PCC 7336]|uniref:aldo/keto reductase n=1 Tax=Synechococcus sp. PCC 7336 TaxID=195250 RepID=UPI000348E1DE|nr:aldo/keto reductase [Synechococcus sp. PCC 7336]